MERRQLSLYIQSFKFTMSFLFSYIICGHTGRYSICGHCQNIEHDSDDASRCSLLPLVLCSHAFQKAVETRFFPFITYVIQFNWSDFYGSRIIAELISWAAGRYFKLCSDTRLHQRNKYLSDLVSEWQGCLEIEKRDSKAIITKFNRSLVESYVYLQ